MGPRNRTYLSDVDALIEHTSVSQVLSHFGKPLPDRDGGEFRMPCVFNESCADSSYGTLTVNLSDVAKRIYCHSCGTRGNLITLIHGLQTHRPPTGGRLRGDEFREAVSTLRTIHGDSPSSPGAVPDSPPPASMKQKIRARRADPVESRAESSDQRFRPSRIAAATRSGRSRTVQARVLGSMSEKNRGISISSC